MSKENHKCFRVTSWTLALEKVLCIYTRRTATSFFKEHFLLFFLKFDTRSHGKKQQPDFWQKFLFPRNWCNMDQNIPKNDPFALFLDLFIRFFKFFLHDSRAPRILESTVYSFMLLFFLTLVYPKIGADWTKSVSKWSFCLFLSKLIP